MKRGRGIKDLDDKSSGMEILMTEAFAKINPTDPFHIEVFVTAPVFICNWIKRRHNGWFIFSRIKKGARRR
jgi:hypothetical protein